MRQIIFKHMIQLNQKAPYINIKKDLNSDDD